MSLLLIPAIDLKDGDCVRLRQGDLADATVFSKDPGEMAARWVEQVPSGFTSLILMGLSPAGQRMSRPFGPL